MANEQKEVKKKLIEPEALLAEMEGIERFNGTTDIKNTENWYELKRRIAAIITEATAEKKE